MVRRLTCFGAIGILLGAVSCFAQTEPALAQPSVTPEQARLLKSSEAFIRNLYTWGPEFKVKLGPLGPSPSPDFYTLPIELTLHDQTQTGSFYLSKDGKMFIRGELFDISVDPFAASRAKLHIEGNPSKGPEHPSVTMVEFADFECPDCRELHGSLKAIETHYPQLRIVFKDFPLAKHPWAETAAIGARCAFMQSPATFWKINDDLYDGQDLISTENVWQKLVDFASQAGLDTGAFKVCMASPDAKKAVEDNMADGAALGVNSTPTVFINGRLIVGSDAAALTQFIDFELAATKK
jgi:protein-disulfide isomerase